MANQNFRVKKGLEVGLGATYLFADDTGVGINSAAPRTNLDVRGTGYIDQLKVGPGTSLVGVGSTYFEVEGDALFDGDVRITGDLLFDDAQIDDLLVAGIATINQLDFKTGVGSVLGVSTLSAETLTVSGVSTFSDIVTIDAPLGITSSVGIAKTLFVGGDVQIGGGITFKGDVTVEIDIEVVGNINQSATGIATFGTINFNTGVGTDLTVVDLTVTGDADINGAGIATIGGDPQFNSLSVTGFSTFGGLNTTGFSTFYQNVRVEEDLQVGGNITLSDLDSGNITVGGTVTTNGLVFNSGIGTELVVGFSSVGILTANTLNVAFAATFGGINTTGVSTFYQSLRVEKDLIVGGDIQLEDLESGNISVGGTVTTNGLVFNTGIGTDLTITGISSLGVITGIGSELQYLPAGSISTSVGVGSTVPPVNRPTGEPIQPGDLWFDSVGLRQYTYFVGLNTLGQYEGNWVDSNPPPIQPKLKFAGDLGVQGSIDIQDDVFDIKGTTNQVTTRTLPALLGVGNTINIGLSTNVSVVGDFEAGGSITGTAATFSGSGSFGSISATSADIGTVTIGDITVGDISVGQVGVDTLSFNVGVGTTLTVQDINVTGVASISGAGIATLGGNANFNNLEVVGVTTLGLTTVKGDLYVSGDLFVADDLTFDEATVRNITVSNTADINNLNFNVGIGTTLSVETTVSVGTTIGVAGTSYLNGDVNVAEKLTVTGISSLNGNTTVDGDLTSTGNITTPSGNISAPTGTVSGDSVSANSLSFDSATGNTITSLVSASFNQIGFTTATGNKVVVSTALDVTGVSSFVGDIEFFKSKGYELEVQRLIVPSDGFVELPGIPVVGGAASFSRLNVTGISTFKGFSSFDGDVLVSGAMTVSSLTADNINFSGGTGIGSESITTPELTVDDILVTKNLNVTGVSTFAGIGTFQDDLYVADDLFVKRDLLVGGATTTGILTATDAYIENLVITGNLQGSGGDAIIIDGDGVISGIVTIGDNSITLDGRAGREYIELGTGSGNRIAGVNTITGEGSYVGVDEGRFNNFISVAGVGSTSTFANDVTVGGTLTIDGQLDFPDGGGGGTGIGSESITTGELTADSITVGFMSATNAAVSGIITAQDFNSLSDRRVKENIRNIENPLEKVDQINGVHFDFVNSGKKSMGVIAQEVEAVFPELISGTFPISVNYNGLIGLLIESVKELKSDNEELRKRIDRLEK